MLRTVLHHTTGSRPLAYRRLQFVQRAFIFRHDSRQRRGFANLPTVLVPPLVFGGLVIALWTWKCLMMVVFQNKIIYMPGLPPNARRETIADYKNQCGGIQWREERTKAADGTRISLCVASVGSGPMFQPSTCRTVYILYFQGCLFPSLPIQHSLYGSGNASSLPSRLPFLSPVLRILQDTPSDFPVRYTIVCCSYRGYWTSKGRPSEKGIALDAAAALQWIEEQNESSEDVILVIWGQSIGAGVATNLAAQQTLFTKNLVLKILILETPFLSIKGMLETLYPQKWLPYRYLHPFLRNHFDSWEALGVMQKAAKELHLAPLRVFILEAGKDELVPKAHGDILERRCIDLGLGVEKKVVHGAFHTEVMARNEGRLATVAAIRDVAQKTSSRGTT